MHRVPMLAANAVKEQWLAMRLHALTFTGDVRLPWWSKLERKPSRTVGWAAACSPSHL